MAGSTRFRGIINSNLAWLRVVVVGCSWCGWTFFWGSCWGRSVLFIFGFHRCCRCLRDLCVRCWRWGGSGCWWVVYESAAWRTDTPAWWFACLCWGGDIIFYRIRIYWTDVGIFDGAGLGLSWWPFLREGWVRICSRGGRYSGSRLWVIVLPLGLVGVSFEPTKLGSWFNFCVRGRECSTILAVVCFRWGRALRRRTIGWMCSWKELSWDVLLAEALVLWLFWVVADVTPGKVYSWNRCIHNPRRGCNDCCHCCCWLVRLPGGTFRTVITSWCDRFLVRLAFFWWFVWVVWRRWGSLGSSLLFLFSILVRRGFCSRPRGCGRRAFRRGLLRGTKYRFFRCTFSVRRSEETCRWECRRLIRAFANDLRWLSRSRGLRFWLSGGGGGCWLVWGRDGRCCFCVGGRILRVFPGCDDVYFEEFDCFPLREILSILYMIGEASSVAVFADDIDIVGGPACGEGYCLAW